MSPWRVPLVIGLASHLALADAPPVIVVVSPATQPAPTTAPAANVSRPSMDAWLRQLRSPDADERDTARCELKGLTPADLPRLHEALVAVRPLPPAQSAAVAEAVVHVLMRKSLAAMPAMDTSFLGINLPPVEFVTDDPDAPIGVPIMGTLTGFAAGRYLEAGDVVLGMGIDNDRFWFKSSRDLRRCIASRRPGTPVELYLLRNGRPRTCAFELDARPDLGNISDDLFSQELRRVLDNLTAQAQQEMVKQFGTVLGLSD